MSNEIDPIERVMQESRGKGWWDGPDRYQNVNRNVITAAQRDVLQDVIAVLAPGPNGWDMGGPGFERNGLHCKGLNIVGGKDLTCDATDLPFEDNSVDYIVSSHAIEHMIDVEKAFREWVRVLRPGGLMAHKMPDRRYFLHDNANPNHAQPDLAPSEMTSDEMRVLLSRIEGLEILLFDTHQNNFDFDILGRKEVLDG